MAYSPTTWVDSPNQSTPINAANLNRIETALTKMPYSPDFSADNVPVWNGSAWASQKIVNAQIDAAAAISYSKLNLAASVVNADIASAAAIVQSKLSFDAPQSYTPTWAATGTAPAIGNGTITGRYMQIGKLVLVNAILTAGSTTTFGTGSWKFSLPVAVNTTTLMVLGIAHGTDTGVNDYVLVPYAADANNVFLLTTVSPATFVGPTIPFTWGNADVVSFAVAYIAA